MPTKPHRPAGCRRPRRHRPRPGLRSRRCRRDRRHPRLQRPGPHRRREGGPGQRAGLPDRRRPLPARRRQRHPQGPGDPHHARLRRRQGRQQPDRDRQGLRAPGVRRAELLGPGLRQDQLQDHPRRPRLGRQGRPPDGRRARGQAPLPGRGLQRPADAQGGLDRVGGRPPRRHDRRLLRRPDPVRRRDAGPPDRRDHPDHHLERPVLLARAGQRRQEAVDRPVLRRRHHLRCAERLRRPRDACGSAPTSSTRRA